MNEIYKVCYKSKINFYSVMKLASTKWNFLKFDPGLVEDIAYQLIHTIIQILQKFGIKTNVILSARKINNSMYLFMYDKILKKIKDYKLDLKKSKILILGLTYKKMFLTLEIHLF